MLDLDGGLPDGPPCDVIVCHLFRDSRLDKAVIERLAPEGLLAITVLSGIDTDRLVTAIRGGDRSHCRRKASSLANSGLSRSST